MSDHRATSRQLSDVVAAAVGRSVVAMTVVHGGDTSAAFRVDLDDGSRRFAKTYSGAPPGFFTTEAWGLDWMRSADAVKVPRVVAVSDGDLDRPAHLVLDWIETRSVPGDEHRFGRSLATLHRAGAPCFGREDRRTTGSLRMPNEPCATWAEFYGSQRLLPLAERARQRGSLPKATIERLVALADRLERFDDGRPPARLHGDLWAGNRIVDRAGESWLIDPACHGGHPEFDLAMMRLFGGFGAEAFEAYRDASPLADGWEERVDLHQIAPLVVHAVKFGGGYVRAATEAIDRYT